MSFLIAYGLGAVIAALALSLEGWSFSYSTISSPALAAYALLGGTATALARVGLAAVLGARAGRFSALGVALAFTSADVIYFVNVGLLPSEPYSSAKSLLFDALALIPFAVLLAWSSRSEWLDERRQQGRRFLAALGFLLLAASLIELGTQWPARATEARPSHPSAAAQAPDLLLVILDSARRDHMSLYGYTRATSAAIDPWAAKGRVYEAAFSASSWTVPTVAALLGAHRTSKESLPTLEELLAKRGYATACFTDNQHLTRGSSLTSPFQQTERSVGIWRDPLRRTLIGEFVERIDGGSDRGLVDRAIAWMRETPSPKFLYVHLMDSHTPYKHPPIDGRRRRGRRIEFPKTGMDFTGEEQEDIVARYDAGIRVASDQAARLLEAFRAQGRPYLALLSSDHGESLGESGRWFHGAGLSPELLAVPLLVVGDDVVPGRVKGTVGHAAVSLTLFAAAGYDCSACAASDLRKSEGDPVVRGGLPPDLTYAVARGHKLVVDVRRRTRRLYSLSDDPFEQRDVTSLRPALTKELAATLEPPPGLSFDRDALERMRSLGYLGAGR